MTAYNPKDERRKNYPHFLTIPTRWRDMDVYQHVNNVVFYAYFDTVINEYLIQTGGLDYTEGDTIGFAVESHCQFMQPIKFPDILDAGLRVAKLGNSSCRYEIGIFKQGDDLPAAIGHFIHVFVDKKTTRPTSITGQMRTALEKLVTE